MKINYSEHRGNLMKINYSPVLAAIAVMFGLAANAATLDLSTGKIDGKPIDNWNNQNVKCWCDDGTTITGTLSKHKQLEIRNDATVTLDNVAINPNGEMCSDPIFAGLTCSNATIVIKGENLVRSFSGATACIYVRKGGTLTIQEDSETGGSLKVFHDKLISGAAGIGGGGTTWERTAGNIVIKSGTIDATGGAWGGAGIGGGIMGAGCGDITIQGGKITARGGNGSAGIGAGTAYPAAANSDDMEYAHCGNITITGGEIEAIGGMTAAGIGGGYLSVCKDIKIEYGTSKVTATRGAGFSASDTTPVDPIGSGYQPEDPVEISVDIDENLKELPSDDPYTRIIAMPATVNLGTVTSDRVIKDNSLVTGTLNGEHQISIADGATVMLQDVHINSEGIKNPKSLLAGITCLGDATIILRGSNTVTSFSCSYPGIYVPKNKTLTIMGSLDDSLEARCNVDEDGNGLAAGIGGGYNERCGNIVIDGGDITAVGGMGSAGIGAGVFKKCGNITINGGKITATGGNGAPGIGGAAGGECGTITVGIGITLVTATAGEGGEVIGIQYPSVNPIGPGAYSSCAGVVIDKDLIDYTNGRTRYLAFSGINLANIEEESVTADNEDNMMTGHIANNLKVKIAAGATVTLKDVTIDGNHAQGIECLGDATIILKGKNIVNGTRGRPAIFVPQNKTLTITGDGELYATGCGETPGAGIGAGYSGYGLGQCGNIRIEGGTIVATGGESGAAGIGSAWGTVCGDITIVGGNVTAIGGWTAAGIGCGSNGKCGNINIGYDNGTALSTDGLIKFERVEARAGESKYSYDAGSPIGLSGYCQYSYQTYCGTTNINSRLQDTTDGLTRIISRKSVNLDDDDLGEGDTYEPEDGESMTGKTTKKVLLKRNTTVSINGVEVSGAVDAPVFDESEGKTETTEFAKSDDGESWEITTFAELSNDSVGSEVEQSQIQVYSAENLEDLETSAAQVESANVEIVEKKSAVMTRIKVTPPTPTPGAKSRFFKVKYGN